MDGRWFVEEYDRFGKSIFMHCRTGYVVAHIRPLKCSGADSTSNMQWQTIEEAKQKDKWKYEHKSIEKVRRRGKVG